LAEWLVEEGIGEHRAILLDGGTIRAARVEWPGQAGAGEVADARLVARAQGSRRGTVRLPSGEEALIDRLPREASEGAVLRIEVTRAAIAERGRTKLAQARPSTAAPRPAPSLIERLRADGYAVRTVPRFPNCDWDDLWAEAWAGTVDFPSGELTVSPTPAMTMIDVDGSGAAATLALAAVPAIARAIARFELAGSIGIDFPSLDARDDRRAVDQALAEALAGWPHERTAMNGFGFVQLVSRLTGPSLVARLAHDRAGAGARLALRRAEAVEAPGVLEISLHPAVGAAIRPEWEAELARRTGRELRWRTDPALAMSGAFAQAVPS
jgi:ribonuclease G